MSRLLERLRKHKDNRGIMANLRCILVDNKKHRAWPVLNRLRIAIKDDDSAYVAGLFATHPEETSTGNFGDTCKAIEQKWGDKRSDDSKLTSTERRFQHLLTAEKSELYGRILRLVLMAKSQGVPVNYEKLIPDLKFWGERTKTEWASAFWTQSAAPGAEEDK
ncbi:MAG: type I-E CRISPR-associated protein Cse2/CasB [Deltaproteobacteria bacterium]|uniref:Type I-E CRISPR-associated protein Cse2/CasB n=1 Tax=Candidatus Desulfacyla euxinica TaxID=2841693 RepID=A0A8J6T7R5_9DELT|nr:type I-E CRISPR-associated protein Cse2/CasB [Candidatus Desulfacyla euxinica]MBL7216361.1 type I-E CRISPR-associated protein Cse2/CasB [Desulfobacteraceae bacterium]